MPQKLPSDEARGRKDRNVLISWSELCVLLEDYMK